MLKLKPQYFGHLVQRTNSFEKTLMLGNIEGGRRRGRQRTRWLNSITNLTDMYTLSWASQAAQWVKDPPAVQETEETQADACRIDPRVRKIPWKRAWQPIPVFLPGESHGQRSLAGPVPRVAESHTRLKWLSMHTRIHCHS